MIIWLRSARHALRGIATAICEERNMALHSIAALCVGILSFVLKLSVVEWALIILCSVLVLCIELANSAYERLIDSLKPRVSVQARTIKDMLAGCVLLSSVGALAIGILIFVPKIVSLFLGSIAG